MKTNLLFPIALIGLLTTSCGKDEDTIRYDFDEKTFAVQQKSWEEQKIQNYQFDQDYMASTGPVHETIVVKNGIATSTNNENGSMFIGNISEIYAKVLNDFEYEKEHQDLPIYGISVDVKYNETYHFPEKIEFSTLYKEQIDGGMWYDLTISNFEILE